MAAMPSKLCGQRFSKSCLQWSRNFLSSGALSANTLGSSGHLNQGSGKTPHCIPAWTLRSRSSLSSGYQAVASSTFSGTQENVEFVLPMESHFPAPSSPTPAETPGLSCVVSLQHLHSCCGADCCPHLPSSLPRPASPTLAICF